MLELLASRLIMFLHVFFTCPSCLPLRHFKGDHNQNVGGSTLVRDSASHIYIIYIYIYIIQKKIGSDGADIRPLDSFPGWDAVRIKSGSTLREVEQVACSTRNAPISPHLALATSAAWRGTPRGSWRGTTWTWRRRCRRRRPLVPLPRAGAGCLGFSEIQAKLRVTISCVFAYLL